MIRERGVRALLATVLFAVVTILLAVGHRDVGYVRDEGIYFAASRDYARWVAEVVEAPARLGDRALRDRRFAINHEHPALMKIAAGVAARTLAPRSGMREGAAMRLPAQLLAGLGAALLFLAASRRTGIAGGLLATGFVFTLPHVWFHAGLHAFDVPVMVAILAVALAYLRALKSAWGSLALGVLLGVAIAIKHNALFMGPLLGLHLVCVVLRDPARTKRWRTLARIGSLPVVSMAVLAPLVAFALWPWLWNAPFPRLREYFAFHAQHNWYNMEFLGVNYNQPPMPFAYPWVMTWATVPTTLLVLAALGLVWRGRSGDAIAPRRVTGTFTSPLGTADPCERLLWTMLGLAPLLLIAWPTTPIFGGTKHWLTAYPFLALAAAQAWHGLWTLLASPRRRVLEPLVLVLVLAPSTWSTVRGHPWNLSQYAPLVGGARGAADLGLNRGFWGHAVLPLLPHVRREDGPICLGDVHPLVQRQYAREGRWPEGIDTAVPPRCRSGLHFYELHMLTNELALWNRFGSAAPRELVALDDVPLASLYGTVD